jgi:diguanylate cyclase (GGDEF)-like protein
MRAGFLALYCGAGCLFGFLLWAGCREAATGQPLRPVHFAALAPMAVFAVVAPALLPRIYLLFPFHAFLIGCLFVLALLATRRFPRWAHAPTTGLWVLRVALAGLAVLFWHYALVAGYAVYVRPGAAFPYLALSSLYDVLLQTGLAFGMVLMATDRIRGELAAKNEQLAAAAAELAQAARTDALTGLLNRRALDELIRDPTPRPAGAVGVLDFNDLKPLNDKFGHAAGDVALQLVGRALRVHFRVTDPLFRTGGDEFVVVMPGCSELDLANRLIQVEAALAGQRLPGHPGPADLSVAWGVAAYGSPADLGPAVHTADEAMYRRKREQKKAVRAKA